MAESESSVSVSAARSVWPTSKESYRIEEIVGYGGTASVQAAMCIPLDKRVAIKRIDLDACTISIEDILKEVSYLEYCRFFIMNIQGSRIVFIISEPTTNPM